MIRLFKITTWLVICLSSMFMFFILFAIIAVGAAGHNSRNTLESGVAFLYLAALPTTLIMTQIEKYKNKHTTTLASALSFIGIVFCSYGLYDNYLKEYGRTEYMLSGVPLILLFIVFVGLMKKKI